MLTAGIFTKLKNARVKRGTITTSVLASRLYRRKVANWIQQGDDHPLAALKTTFSNYPPVFDPGARIEFVSLW